MLPRPARTPLQRALPVSRETILPVIEASFHSPILYAQNGGMANKSLFCTYKRYCLNYKRFQMPVNIKHRYISQNNAADDCFTILRGCETTLAVIDKAKRVKEAVRMF